MTFDAAAPALDDSLTVFDVDAVLFDLDGTLIDSTVATERAWTLWGEKMGIAGYRHTAHGMTALTLVNELVDAPRRAEALELITRLEIEDTDGIRQKEGTADLLAAIPSKQWTIVTSCTRELARARMAAAGLDWPEHMVTADQVTTGKPSPEGFLLAAKRLGADIRRCLVVEDAPAGLSAGRSANAQTLGVTGTYGARQLEADAVVASLGQLTVSRRPGAALVIEIRDR
ncbi:HAD-IA family hydrolase [Arthrobacter sp. Sa2CUA1]|uniref:HAD-IA family hydrolase n=1 Tax=Arthrobacter gallicola TaxID=2762225 RepID=A0ABR8UUD0_9MICC|nr:HAD-IA family hydrolase [Arthrobacter gallicola]MBD7995686.1 HAD-IA family hydrolase [Arthrobacter gallicola]